MPLPLKITIVTVLWNLPVFISKIEIGTNSISRLSDEMILFSSFSIELNKGLVAFILCKVRKHTKEQELQELGPKKCKPEASSSILFGGQASLKPFRLYNLRA